AVSEPAPTNPKRKRGPPSLTLRVSTPTTSEPRASGERTSALAKGSRLNGLLMQGHDAAQHRQPAARRDQKQGHHTGDDEDREEDAEIARQNLAPPDHIRKLTANHLGASRHGGRRHDPH